MSLGGDKTSYHDILSKTRYMIEIGPAVNIEDVSDEFIDSEEYRELTGNSMYGRTAAPRTNVLHTVVKTELEMWAGKLEGCGRKSIVIDDEELVTALKHHFSSHVSDYVGETYCRHGDRLRYSVSRKRVKTKVTKTDARIMWSILHDAFHSKYGAHLPYTPVWYRRLALFNVYKKIVGWRAARERILKGHYTHSHLKFYRKIWDNPEEHYS